MAERRLRTATVPRLLTLAGGMLLAGCAGDNRLAGDPLLGGGGAVAAAPAARPTAPLPPLPAPSPSASNAALASNASRPLEGSSELRIGPDPRPVASGGGSWQGTPPPGTPTLNPPVPPTTTLTSAPASPLPPPITAAPPVASHSFTPVAGGRVGSYEQAQAQLAAYGVTWQRLETWGDKGWKFSCSIPNPQNKSISRNYEAQAGDYLSAVRAVLDQISRDRVSLN